ncbi:hypothetical protein VOA_001646 [Vibrio sp. RC586]|nr:hypothetical protein VOA_001646 [Vibrio sp. RC586]
MSNVKVNERFPVVTQAGRMQSVKSYVLRWINMSNVGYEVSF